VPRLHRGGLRILTGHTHVWRHSIWLAKWQVPTVAQQQCGGGDRNHCLPANERFAYFLAGGDLDEIKTMRSHIEAWGIQQGCGRASLAGRKGWAKTFLKDEGYEPAWFILKKDLI